MKVSIGMEEVSSKSLAQFGVIKLKVLGYHFNKWEQLSYWCELSPFAGIWLHFSTDCGGLFHCEDFDLMSEFDL